eukprot:g2116.t1
MNKQPTPVKGGDLEAALTEQQLNQEATDIAGQLARQEKEWSGEWDAHKHDHVQPHGVELDCCGIVCLDSGLLKVSPRAEGVVCYKCPAGLCGVLLFAWNLLLTVPLLVLHAVSIYILPCFSITLKRLVCSIMCCGWRFRDLAFPATDQSLGHAKGVLKLRKLPPPVCNCCCICFRVRCDCYDPCGGVIPWRHAGDLPHVDEKKPMVLFHEGIEADDICQGELGDCWLLSALACVAEKHPELIKSCFVTREADKCGCYAVRLFDMRSTSWRTFWIDDRVPVHADGTPLFASPNGNEMWVLLFEKAYAKMVGSYSGLVGGHARWGLEAITGNHAVTLSLTGGQWRSSELGKSYSHDQLFHMVDKSLEHDMLACAGTKHRPGGSDTKGDSTHGIVPGHAYTLLDCYKTVTNVRVVQLRNPWGGFEWDGRFSDNDHEFWSSLGASTMSLRGKMVKKEDGKFWMPFEDFVRYYDHIDLCATGSSMSDLELDLNEDSGKVLGLCKGAALGCLSYWCPTGCCNKQHDCELQGCLGPRRMWFPLDKSTKEILLEHGA